MQNFATKLLSVIGTFLVLLLQILLSLVLTCILGPIFILAWLINELTRAVISLVLWIRHKSKIHLVPSGADNIWHYKKKGNNRICFFIAFCKDQINLQAHQELYFNRVIKHETPEGSKPYEKLKKTFIQKWGYYCFREEEHFEIDNHIRIYPGSDSILMTESDLMSKILPELCQDMDDSQPQWEEVIVPRFKYDNDEKIVTVRIFRYHHGYLDGASALLLWANCMTKEGQDGFPYPVNPLKAVITSKLRMFIIDLFCILMAAWTMVKSMYTGATMKSRYVTNEYSGQRVFAWSEKIDVNDLKEIKAGTKVSLPTVIAASTGAALRKLDKKFPSSNPKFRGRIQETEIIGMVNAILPYPDIHPKNHFTITHFSLPTGDLPWYQRIMRTDLEMKKLAWEPAVFLNFFMFKFFGRFPTFVVQNVMQSGGVPISFSNGPLTKTKISLWGNHVEESLGWPPLLTNTGLGITTIRYADHMRFCCIADESCLSSEELQFLAREVSEEIRVMAEDCRNSSHTKRIDFISDPLKQVVSDQV